MLNKDHCNRKSNQKNLGTIKSSNLCVAGDTVILTKEFGQVPIVEVVDQKLHVWNGEQWSETVVRKTNDAASLWKISFNNGVDLHCTAYHKFFIQDGYPSQHKPVQQVEAKALEEGMRIPRFSLPDGKETPDAVTDWDCKYPYTQGLFAADGTYQPNGNPSLALYHDKMELLPYMDVRSTTGKSTKQNVINTQLHLDMREKYFVPINASVETKLQWLAGFMDGDGTVAHPPAPYTTCITLQSASIHKDMLDRVRLMLQTLGVESSICFMRGKTQHYLPDGKGRQKLYDCQPLWRLLINSTNVWKLKQAGFTPHRLDLSAITECPTNKSRSIMVTNVEVTDRVEPTYCFNEPLKHAGIFNGILTGNCTEIIEYSSPTETAVCNLASVALPKFVNRETRTFDHTKLYQVCRVMIKALNKVIDRNYYPVEEARRSNMRHRPVGLGIQGLADVFLLMRIRYGSPESKQLNRDIAETMYFACMTESHALTQAIDPETKEPYGPYPSIDENGGAPVRHGIFQFDMWKEDFKDTDNPDGWKPNPDLGWDWDDLKAKVMADGVRNSLLVTQMPTASTAQILGNLESFEPYYGAMFVRRTKAGEFYQYCRPLIEDLVKLGLWKIEQHPDTKKPYIPMKEKIKEAKGSIQDIDEIPQELKDIYVTIQDISLKDLTIMARDRAIFTDQSMSLNIHFKNKDNMMPKLLQYDIFAWKLGLKTSSYYTRTIQDMAVLNFTGANIQETEECTSCSA
jgi:ribonucleoside-diphosphate reductase alpha chain